MDNVSENDTNINKLRFLIYAFVKCIEFSYQIAFNLKNYHLAKSYACLSWFDPDHPQTEHWLHVCMVIHKGPLLDNFN